MSYSEAEYVHRKERFLAKLGSPIIIKEMSIKRTNKWEIVFSWEGGWAMTPLLTSAHQGLPI